MLEIAKKDILCNALFKLNIAFTFCVGALVILLIFNLNKSYQPHAAAKMAIGQITQADKSSAFTQKAAEFKEEIFKKQLFSASAGKAGIEKKEFVLLGISFGDKKNIAVIRNTAEKKDYYCSEGDIIGEFTVKQIQRDEVILEAEGNLLVISR